MTHSFVLNELILTKVSLIKEDFKVVVNRFDVFMEVRMHNLINVCTLT